MLHSAFDLVCCRTLQHGVDDGGPAGARWIDTFLIRRRGFRSLFKVAGAQSVRPKDLEAFCATRLWSVIGETLMLPIAVNGDRASGAYARWLQELETGYEIGVRARRSFACGPNIDRDRPTALGVVLSEDSAAVDHDFGTSG